jgi:hypothetical protein
MIKEIVEEYIEQEIVLVYRKKQLFGTLVQIRDGYILLRNPKFGDQWLPIDEVESIRCSYESAKSSPSKGVLF